MIGVSKKHSYLYEFFLRLVREKPLGTIGGIIVLIMLIVGIFANLIAPYGMNEPNIIDRLEPPGSKYLFGTDNLGRDMLSRIIYGTRISIIVGLCTSTLAVAISTAVGLTSGYFGGKIDVIIQRFVDAFMCFPSLFLMLTIMALLGPGIFQVIIVLGLLFGVTRSRVVRSAVIAIKENIYVEAARAIGAPNIKILIRHILPNIMAPIIVLFTLNVGTAIISEATISFLGFGVPPPNPSWGGMLSGAGRRFMLEAPWMAFWPGASLAIVVYGINMLGDALRDLLDPRLRGGLGSYSATKVKKSIARKISQNRKTGLISRND